MLSRHPDAQDSQMTMWTWVLARAQEDSHRDTQAAQKAPERLEQAAGGAIRTGQGLFQDLAAAQRSLEDQGVRWGELLGYALLATFTFGFAFQVRKRRFASPSIAVLTPRMRLLVDTNAWAST